MNLNLFYTAFRHLGRQSWYSISTAIGLSLALTIFYFSIGLVFHETFTDKNFKDSGRIYRVISSFTLTDDRTFDPNVPVQVGDAIADGIPEIETITPIHDIKTVALASYKGTTFKELNWVLTDRTFPSLFDSSLFSIQLPFIEGTILLDQTTARKIFGPENPIGQILETDRGNFLVAGLFKDFPSNSHLQIRAAAIPMSGVSSKNAYLYARIADHAEIGPLNQKIQAQSKLLEPQFGPFTYTLQNIKGIYEEGVTAFVVKGASRERTYLIIAMTAIILLISVFNVFHFTYVKCLFRGKEVGIKKVLGIQASQLTLQFFVESSIIVMSSIFLAVVISRSIEHAAFSYLRVSSINQILAWGTTGILAFVVIVLLTLLQSRAFSNVAPRIAIAGSNQKKSSGNYIKLTVAAQFFISTLLISGAVLVHKQLNYISSLPLGFEINDLWFINAENENIDLTVFKNEISDIPGIESATLSSAIPTEGYMLFVYNAQGEQRKLFECTVDEDFFETYKIPFISPPLDLAANSLILTESAAVIHDEFLKGRHYVGVVKDFHSLKLTQPIMPIRFLIGDSKQGFVTVRAQKGKELTVKESLEQKWMGLYPNEPITVSSLRDHFMLSHQSVHDINQLVNVLLAVSIFVSCVGLSSLVSFYIQKRYKELAIRKVLGASIKQLLLHLNVKFLAIICCSSLISIPFFNHFGSLWLDSFSYHTDIDLVDYFVPSACVSTIAIAVMLARSWKPTTTNPVDALRSE